jgi:hypothetical protein
MPRKFVTREIFLIFYFSWFVLGGMLLAWFSTFFTNSPGNTEDILLAGAVAGVVAGGVIAAFAQVMAWLLRHRLPPHLNTD